MRRDRFDDLVEDEVLDEPHPADCPGLLSAGDDVVTPCPVCRPETVERLRRQRARIRAGR